MRVYITDEPDLRLDNVIHVSTATISYWLDKQERSLRTLELHSPEWHEFWKSVPPGSDVFVEMSRTTWWFARWVQDQGHEAHVVDSARSRAMAAEMGAKDVLPEVYVIHPQTERLRELVRHRALWVRDRTRVKNRIHYQLAREQRHCPPRSVFSQRGLRWLEGQRLCGPHATSLANHRAHYDFVERQAEQATERLCAVEINGRTLERLLSIPGIGEHTARTLIAEIETTLRFSDPEKLISYAGLAPRVRQSATRDRRGALTKRGSLWLRTALIKSAQVAVRQPNQFQRVFRRVAFRHGRNVGIVTAARRLAEAIWHVWWKDAFYCEPGSSPAPES